MSIDWVRASQLGFGYKGGVPRTFLGRQALTENPVSEGRRGERNIAPCSQVPSLLASATGMAYNATDAGKRIQK